MISFCFAPQKISVWSLRLSRWPYSQNHSINVEIAFFNVLNPSFRLYCFHAARVVRGLWKSVADKSMHA